MGAFIKPPALRVVADLGDVDHEEAECVGGAIMEGG